MKKLSKIASDYFEYAAFKEFIVNQGTGDWINVGDIQKDPEGNPAASSDWRDQYDIYSTPVIYLLDKLKHDKGNFNLRLELANNLENLDVCIKALPDFGTGPYSFKWWNGEIEDE